MLVINEKEERIRLYLHEFKGEISLMASDGSENTVLLRFDKLDHKVRTNKGTSIRMGFEIHDNGHLVIRQD